MVFLTKNSRTLTLRMKNHSLYMIGSLTAQKQPRVNISELSRQVYPGLELDLAQIFLFYR